MSAKPAGVFVRLPLSADDVRKMDIAIARSWITQAKPAQEKCAEDGILAIGTPVTGGNLDPSRESFEKFYAQMCARATGHNTTPEYVSGLRTGDTYGGRTYLNNVWQAWPEYVQYSQSHIAALEAEVVRLRGVIVESVDALTRVTEERSTQYQAKNGRWVSIQADDGERCDIIHSDITTDCEAAILSAHKALKGGAS